MKQKIKGRAGNLCLLLLASIWIISPAWAAQVTIGKGGTLLETLGLESGVYWASINGGVPVPIDNALTLPPGTHDVYLLRRQDKALQSVGWFEVIADDSSAQTQPERASRILLDRRPPAAEFSIKGTRVDVRGVPVVSPDVQIALNFRDMTGVTKWRVTDSHPQSTMGGRWLPGFHQLTVNAADAAGNSGRAGELSFQVDGQPPEIRVEIQDQGFTGADGLPVYRTPVQVAVAVSDDSGVSSTEALLEDRWQAVDSEKLLSVAEDRIRVRAEDAVGNETEETVVWQYDTEGPVIELMMENGEKVTGPSLSLIQNEKILIRLTDNGAGVQRAEYRYNNGAYQRLPSAIRFRDLGHYRLHIRAWDRFGNWNSGYWNVRTVRPAGAASGLGAGLNSGFVQPLGPVDYQGADH